MSFIGSINDKLRKFFYTYAPLLEGRRCFVGCSGNFTIEQLISRQCSRTEIHSNDVSLYSSAIGHMLAPSSPPFPLSVSNPELLWADGYLNRGPSEQVATILLLLEMLKYEKRKNPFSERMWQVYLSTFDALFSKTLDRVRTSSSSIRIHEYTMTDVFDYYPCPSPTDIAIGFLPTYVGGYEKLFARLEESIAWPTPPYQLLTTERREETIRKMTTSDYLIYDDRPRDLPCAARVDLFGHKTVYIYSNLRFKTGIFRKKINEKTPSYDLLMPDDEISRASPVSVLETDIATINHYRNMFLSKKIQPGSGGPCYLVFTGSKLFGFLIFQAYSQQRSASPNEIYLLSDFVVPSTRYRRLAKLLLMVSLCVEMKETLSTKIIRDYKSIYTTAFTDQPVSMKYRGVYELVKRGEGFLNYRGRFSTTSFKEVTALWMKKYAKPSPPSTSSSGTSPAPST